MINNFLPDTYLSLHWKKVLVITYHNRIVHKNTQNQHFFCSKTMYSHQNHLRFRLHLMAIRFPELLHFRFPNFFGHFRFPEFRQLRFPFPVLLPVYPQSIFFRQNNLGEKDKRHTR